ncbi:MAG TPA: TonB family protein [Mucilaginibacter sp.]|jgi:protein TonB|nr:TonB family protein [Mucilaginibacter sp.]
MSITKLDLYNPEWLELVFDSKNKDYGAYELRQHYASTLVKSMAIAFFSVAVLYTGYIVLKPKYVPGEVLVYHPVVIPPPTNQKDHPVIPPKAQTIKPPAQVATIKYPSMVPTDDKNATNPPDITDLKTAAIGTETKKGNGEGVNIDIPDQGTGTVIPSVTEDKPKETYEIQVMPQPYGGEAAWGKFLQKNMHYPPAAIEAHAQGKVFLSFIVEKDGHISNIVVERGVGYGLDEEAVRVLKLAPAWKPGIQNGHQVRVKFSMPISFQLSDPD